MKGTETCTMASRIRRKRNIIPNFIDGYCEDVPSWARVATRWKGSVVLEISAQRKSFSRRK